jgi:hypothetical protein
MNDAGVGKALEQQPGEGEDAGDGDEEVETGGRGEA